MKALESRVIIKVDESALKTKIGNFEINENVEDYEQATVVSVGPKAEGIAVDDCVYIYKHAGKEFKIDGSKYRAVTLSEIIVVL